MIWIQALIILACIMLGARKSGVAMGFAGGVGLFILVFVFGLKPASPPVNVLLIIIAVSSMAATLQVAGGLDLLVHLAEKVLRSRLTELHSWRLSSHFCLQSSPVRVMWHWPSIPLSAKLLWKQR